MRIVSIVALALVLCMGLLGCDQVNPTTGINSEKPTDNSSVASTPFSALATSSIPQTTIPLPPATTMPEVKKIVTPINAYVPTTWEKNENFVELAEIVDVYENLEYEEPAVLGEVAFAKSISKAIEQYPDNTYFNVKVSIIPTLRCMYGGDWRVWTSYQEDIRQDLMQRFIDAGYYVHNMSALGREGLFFGLFISVEQLKALDCGDDISVVINVHIFAES